MVDDDTTQRESGSSDTSSVTSARSSVAGRAPHDLGPFLLTFARSVRSALPVAAHRLTQRASSDLFQFTAKLVAVGAVTSYVALVFLVRHPSIDAVSLRRWLECLVLLAPTIPILTRRERHSSLRGAWVLMGVGIVLFDLADVLRLLSLARERRCLGVVEVDARHGVRALGLERFFLD